MDLCEEDWKSRAKCAGKGDEFALSDHPYIQERTTERKPEFVDWVNMERRKFLRSEQTCLDCPAFVKCGETATIEDKEWTMRAGEWPRALVRAERSPAHTCSIPSHQPRSEGSEIVLPYCYRCEKANKNRPTTRAGRRAASEAKKYRQLSGVID